MIIGSLENTARAEKLHPRFKEVFDYLKSHDLVGVPAGKIALGGEEAWIAVSEIPGKEKGEARLETHDKYIDIQLPVCGCETFGWQARERLQEPGSYDPANDITFYGDAPAFYFPLEKGRFAIFFPEDGHAPCIGTGIIKKLVVKVKL